MGHAWRVRVWCLGVLLLLLSVLTAFVGYVLPWGQMSFWGATVITSLASALPVVGYPLVSWLWGGHPLRLLGAEDLAIGVGLVAFGTPIALGHPDNSIHANPITTCILFRFLNEPPLALKPVCLAPFASRCKASAFQRI